MSAPVTASKARSSCHDAPSGQVLLGIRQFNSHQWYQCHETFEALWLVEQGEVRHLYQGIIQLAIAQHHWQNGNLNGALALLCSAIGYLERVAGSCLWIDVTTLIGQAAALQQALKGLDAASMHTLDQVLLLQISTVSS